MTTDDSNLFRQLPSIHEALERPELAALLGQFSREQLIRATRSVLLQLRDRLRAGALDGHELRLEIGHLDDLVRAQIVASNRPELRRVLNATGVILQTNFGRAPLSRRAIERIADVASGYCNLEYDLSEGKRSQRDVHAEGLLLRLMEARLPTPVTQSASGSDQPRAAAVVNNCAAATFLALNTLADGGEVIVSRGELVEIGGGFRIPDILAKSGAVLREVGTTNKTRVSDYASALSERTRLILRVHRSNFRIEGFTEDPSLADLVELSRRAMVPLFEDQGTGCIVDLAEQGLPGEASWLRSVGSGASLIAASGDKLLGGPQCGLLLGNEDLLRRIRANPLYRALRVDKLTYAALEATLLAYLTHAEEELPILRMLRLPSAEVRARCERLLRHLEPHTAAHFEVSPVQSAIGGGTTPGAFLPSFALAISEPECGEQALAGRFRQRDLPVIGRVQDGRVFLDLRTVDPGDDELLKAQLLSVLSPLKVKTPVAEAPI